MFVLISGQFDDYIEVDDNDFWGQFWGQFQEQFRGQF